MSVKYLRLLLLLAVVSLVGSACTLPWKKAHQENVENKDNTPAEVKNSGLTDNMKRFSDYQELSSFLASHQAAPSVAWGDGVAAENITLPGGEDNSGSSASDLVKSSNGFIYSLVKNDLAVLKIGTDGTATLIGKINFSFRPSGLFLEEGALAVYGTVEDSSDLATSRSKDIQYVRVFDLSDPADPKESRDLAFEGDFGHAFIRGGYLYFLTEMSGYDPAAPVLPKVFDKGKVLSADCNASEKCFAPQVYYFDSNYDSYRFLNIAAINLKDAAEAISGQAYVLNEKQHFAVSGGNIFIAHLKSSSDGLAWEIKKGMVSGKLDDDRKKIISEIEAAPAYLLSEGEKKNKVASVIENYIGSLPDIDQAVLKTEIENAVLAELSKSGNSAETIIHKIVPTGSKIDYFTTGRVPGLLFNKASLLDDGSNLFVATGSGSSGEEGEKKYHSSVYVLDSLLENYGKIENLATKEAVYGARFIGTRGFLVSAGEGGSVYVINLSDKANPVYEGTIKVPGLANQLKSVDADGKKFISLSYATEEGTENKAGLKLSLFDFSDLKQPKEIDSFLIGDKYSDSIAFSDPNAFFFSSRDGILSIPVSFKADDRLNFSGALVFSLQGDSMEMKGRVDHSSGGFYNQPDRFASVSYLENTVRRSLYLAGNLYSFSNKFARYGRPDKIEESASLELSDNTDDALISSVVPSSSLSESGQQSTTETPLSTDQPISGSTTTTDALNGAFNLVPDPAAGI